MKKRYLSIVIGILSTYFVLLGQNKSHLTINDSIEYYAYFHRIVNTDDDFVRIYNIEMSGNGEKIIFSGSDENTDPALYTIHTDGTELVKIPLPEEMGGIPELTISYDGSIAYFYTTEHNAIYRVEAGVCEKIFETNNYDYVNDIYGIKTTADGLYIYFEEYQNDIWLTSRDGGAPLLIIDDKLIQRDKGMGARIAGFDISDDGNNIIFKMLGYTDQEGWFQTKEELFVYSSGSVKQITNHAEHTIKESFSISGDGKIIVYNVAYPENKWYSIIQDATNPINIGDMGFNFGGLELSHNGEVAFYNDAASNGGRIINSNGDGCIDLFDGYNKVMVRNSAQINDDGNLVSFIHQYASFPMKEAIYIGYINNEETTMWSPRIKDIHFDPEFMPIDNPEIFVDVFAEIKRDDMYSRLEYISGANTIAGILNTGWTNTPIVWGIPFHDDGQEPDLEMNDDIYSTSLGNGDLLNEYSSVGIRVSVMDSLKNMVVADVRLGIGGTVDVNETDETTNFSLSPNYPNPFNPSTKIKYSIPKQSNVTIKVFDLLGSEVAELINKEQPQGFYEIEFDASTSSATGSELTSGIYFYRIQAGDFVQTRKMILLK